MSQSNVGNSAVYEADDQRTYSDEEIKAQVEKFKEGQANSHKAQDSKDERTIANKLERELQRDDSGSGKDKDLETQLGEIDPTLPAKMHGNEPSKGAKIDKEIMDEEAEILAKKGSFGPKGS